MSSDTMGASSSVLQALWLEQQILGPEWYPLACGCQLSIQCRLPGPKGYMNLHGVGHRLHCDEHKANSFLNRWAALKTFMHWYAPGTHNLKIITKDEFEEEWDKARLESLSASTPIRSAEDRHMIFRSGAVAPRD